MAQIVAVLVAAVRRLRIGYDDRVLRPGVVHASEAGAWEMVRATPAAPLRPHVREYVGWYECAADADAFHDRARAAGAEIVRPLKNQDYGSRDFSARASGGHLWSFGTYREGNGQAGAATLFPALHFDDGPGAMQFLSTAFGFTPGLVVPGVETASYGARGYLARDPEGFMWHFSNYSPPA